MTKKQAFRHATRVTLALLKKEERSATRINSGLCYIWAIEVCRHLDGAAQKTNTSVGLLWGQAHTWIYFDKKHYDAECLDGVEDWKELPIFQRS